MKSRVSGKLAREISPRLNLSIRHPPSSTFSPGRRHKAARGAGFNARAEYRNLVLWRSKSRSRRGGGERMEPRVECEVEKRIRAKDSTREGLRLKWKLAAAAAASGLAAANPAWLKHRRRIPTTTPSTIVRTYVSVRRYRPSFFTYFLAHPLTGKFWMNFLRNFWD